MPIVVSNCFAHVRITVTDIMRSKAFYDAVFGWPAIIDSSDRINEPGVRTSPADFYGGTVYRLPGGALFGLRPVASEDDRFDSERVGLDHICFQVGTRQELLDAASAFDLQGIEHGGVVNQDFAGVAILSFSDPDGVHCELTAPI